jgi:hypothetical protein
VSLTEIQDQVAALTPESRRKLIGFMVMLDLKEDADQAKGLYQRLNDTSPDSWIPVEEVKRRLHEIP